MTKGIKGIVNKTLSRLIWGYRNLKYHMVRILGEESLTPWAILRYGIGAAFSGIAYEASIADYFEMRFFEKSHKVKKTYFTAKAAKRFILHMNGAENNAKFMDKIYMYRSIGNFTKREQLFCPPESYQEFEAFFTRHHTALYKANTSYCGTGVEWWSLEASDMKALYEKAMERTAVLDEPVVQHPNLARINPDSVNTVKIFTFMEGDLCHMIAAEFRMGRSGLPIDNIERGGIAAGVNLKTGALLGKAYDLQLNQYAVHPDTGAEIEGFVLPNWKELLRFTEECARACPLVYAEWDVAIRENDCVMIEVNPNARNCGIQMGAFHGRKKQFEELEKLHFAANKA